MEPSWTAWAPTIVSGLIFVGGYLAVVREHSRRLNRHDERHDETAEHDARQDLALMELQAWNKGFSAARERYERN